MRAGYYYWNGNIWADFITDTNADAFGIPRMAYYRLETFQNNFLNGVGAGGVQNVPVTEVFNKAGSANGTTVNVSFNSGTNLMTMQPGIYKITFVYEGTHNATGCTISSYFVDFPEGAAGSVARIHSTASHIAGAPSNHGNTVTYVARLTTAYNWRVALGRGQSGNCSGAGMSLAGRSTFVTVERLSDL